MKILGFFLTFKTKPFLLFSAITTAVFCAFSIPQQALAQKEAEAKDTGVLAVVLSRNIQPYLSALEGFNEVMDSRGFKFHISRYNLNGNMAQGNIIAEQIRQQKPDLILAIGTEATKSISSQITDVPIVFSMSLNTNIAESRRRQGNIAGASMNIPMENQLNEIVSLLPNVKKVGLVCNPLYYSAYISEWEKTASDKMNLKLIVKFARNETEFTDAVRLILSEIDAFLFVPDENILSPKTTQFMLLETFRYNKPVIAPSLRFVEEGALFALGSDYRDIGRQSAELAIQILQGKNAGDLPITEARTTHLYLSLRTARQMGIPIPQGTISRAEKVFE